MGKTIMVNIEKCLACRSCELACAVAHSISGILEDAITEHPKPQKRVTIEAAAEYSVPMQCRHCEDAPCITVCPTSAIQREKADGPVLIKQDRCIGCKFCLIACPFGVIDISKDNRIIIKCDLCVERIEAGKVPACIEACPTKALEFVYDKNLVAGRRHRAAKDVALSARQNKKIKKRKESV
jgi:carbon-monoxide dehydrogenase iron sulfur subunit